MPSPLSHVGNALAHTLLLLALLFVPTQDAAAQGAMDPRPPATPIQWWHPLAATAGVGVLILVDEPLADFLQDNQSSFADDVSDVATTFKNPEVYVVATAGALALGLATGDRKITATGVHIASAYGVAGALNIGAKWLFGRSRPSQTPGDATNFDFFDGGEDSAFPSGSAAVVFSLAATVSDAVDRKPVTIALYTGATLNAWARMYTNRHWLTDVAVGALIGVTSAKLVNGEWTVFGLRPPALWTDGQSLSMGYALPTW